jgi:hypothetical protein
MEVAEDRSSILDGCQSRMVHPDGTTSTVSFAAYGLAPAASDEAILAALLELNQRRAKG